MNSAQMNTLKAAIAADATMNAFANDSAGNSVLASYLNAPTNPAVNVWRPSIAVSEITGAVDWAAFAALTNLKQTTYLGLTQGGMVDATSATVRAAFAAIFGVGSATTTALSALAQRTATRFENAFLTSGVSSVFGQLVTFQDVQASRDLP